MSKLQIEITVIPEMKPGTLFFQQAGLIVGVFNRSTKNPQVKITGGAYQPLSDINGSFNSRSYQPLSIGSSYDIFYKDDDIAEKYLGQAIITPLSGNCYVDSAEVVSATFRRLSDGRITTLWGFGWNNTNDGKYQISTDGGATFKAFPETAGTNFTEFSLIQSPQLANFVIRRTDIACSYTPLLTFNNIDIPTAAACTLEFDTPAFVKTNETLPGANNGTIRAIIVAGSEQGTVEYQLKNADGTIAADWQTDDTFTGLAPGTYRLLIRDDVCSAIQYENTIGILAYQSEPTEDAPSSTREYINNPNFTRFRFLSGVTIDDFLGGGGVLPPPDDEVIDPTPENANLRITTGGDQRITATGDRRITD